jgi:hypothetical protein
VARASKPLTEGRSAVCARLLCLWAWVFVDVSWAEAIVVMPNRPRAAADTIAIHAFLIVRFSERRKIAVRKETSKRGGLFPIQANIFESIFRCRRLHKARNSNNLTKLLNS